MRALYSFVMSASAQAQTAAAPVFSDDSMIRRIHREGILMLGGGRALLMQLAHPLVAQGVAEHSRFQAGRTARLLSTLRPIHAIIFGSPSQATNAVASIRHVHERVTGEGYRADDPDLLLWVLVTLIDTALVVHERFVRPLSAVEAEAYYGDMAALGSALGIPGGSMPADIAGFRRYVDSMVASLEVSPTGVALAREVLRTAPGIGLFSPAMQPLTAGLLPPRLREQFGLAWGPRRESALRGAGHASRSLLPLVPRRLRAPPWFVMPAADQGRSASRLTERR